VVKPPAAAVPRADIRIHDAQDFNSFRHSCYLKYRDVLERTVVTHGSSTHLVRDLRLAPVGSGARARFMAALRSLQCSESDVALTFHGTRLSNMDSICRRGLLIPRPGNAHGLTVANGSTHGIGVYTCREASYPFRYAAATTSTLFVCAALTRGAKSKLEAREAREAQAAAAATGSKSAAAASVPALVHGDVIVLMEESRVCPLFLLDFDVSNATPTAVSKKRPLIRAEEPPFISPKLTRRMLAKVHDWRRREARRGHNSSRQPDPVDLVPSP
jgi:hypothetical protein